MGRPHPADAPPGRQRRTVTQPLAETVRNIDKDPGKGRETPPCQFFTMPDSVMKSIHFKGEPCDLSFGIREPSTADVKKLVTQDANMEEAAPRFVVRLGDPNYEDGVPCTYREAAAWWARLSPKAKTMVTTVFMEMIVPSEEEGNQLRASKRTVG